MTPPPNSDIGSTSNNWSLRLDGAARPYLVQSGANPRQRLRDAPPGGCGNHRLEFGCVFAEVVPERGERGRFRRTPHLGELPGQQRGRAKVFLKIVRRAIALNRPDGGEQSPLVPDMTIAKVLTEECS